MAQTTQQLCCAPSDHPLPYWAVSPPLTAPQPESPAEGGAARRQPTSACSRRAARFRNGGLPPGPRSSRTLAAMSTMHPPGEMPHTWQILSSKATWMSTTVRPASTRSFATAFGTGLTDVPVCCAARCGNGWRHTHLPVLKKAVVSFSNPKKQHSHVIQ